MDSNFINPLSALNKTGNNFEHTRGHNDGNLSATPQIIKGSKQAAEQLEALDRSKTLYAIAHDLKNPLSTIFSLTELILRRGQLTDEIKEYINHIRNITASSLEFTQDVIYSANLDSQENATQVANINHILSESINTLKYQALEKEQQLFFEPSINEAKALINRAQITRVVTNIISNAIKFTGNNKTIKITVSALENHVLISVQDEGIGIPDNLKYHIFNPFTDAKRQGTSGEASSGLGLSICRQIIEKHNGEIWFEEAKPAGTVFFVRIPKNC